jgi:hypothetical protein
MTIVFGAENRPRIRPLRSDVDRTVGVAKLCRHGLTGKEWSRDPVPTGCFEHGVSMTLTTPTPFLLEMSSPCGASAGQDAGGDGVDSRRSSGSAGTEKA